MPHKMDEGHLVIPYVSCNYLEGPNHYVRSQGQTGFDRNIPGCTHISGAELGSNMLRKPEWWTQLQGSIFPTHRKKVKILWGCIKLSLLIAPAWYLSDCSNRTWAVVGVLLPVQRHNAIWKPRLTTFSAVCCLPTQSGSTVWLTCVLWYFQLCIWWRHSHVNLSRISMFHFWVFYILQQADTTWFDLISTETWAEGPFFPLLMIYVIYCLQLEW